MAEFALTDQFGDYWQQYGLKQSPFEDYPQFAMYYPIPHWQPHLQFLQRFCQSEQSLLLLQGEFGIGKSMFIAEATAQLSQTVSTFQIKGRSSVTPSQLMLQIAEGLQTPEILGEPNLSQQVQLLLTILKRVDKPFLLIIDDADLLPLETLVALTELAMAQQGQSIYLNIMLACELNLHDHLKTIAEESRNPLPMIMLNLEPLTMEEMKNYLKHRLSKAGLSGKIPYNKEIVQHIYDLSGGVPGRVNRVAQQTLIDLLKPNEERIPSLQQQGNSFSFLKPTSVKTTSLILLVLLVLLYWKMQEPGATHHHYAQTAATPAKDQQQVTIALSPLTSSPSSAPVDKVLVNPNATENANPQELRTAEADVIAGHHPQAPTETVNNTLAPAAVVATTATSIVPPQSINTPNTASPPSKIAVNDNTAQSTITPAVAAPAIATVSANSVTVQPAAPAKIKPLAVLKHEKAVKPTPTEISEVMGEKKEEKTDKELLSATEKKLLGLEGYTLQLIASRKVEDLSRFISANKLSQGQVMQFQTQLNGKPWHVLVYGNYASQQQAKAILKQLTSKVHSTNAWVRPMTSVHMAINNR